MSQEPHDAESEKIPQVLAWLGGNATWTTSVIAEQVGDPDDPAIRSAVERAAAAGFLEAREDGYRLTEAGWAIADGRSADDAQRAAARAAASERPATPTPVTGGF